MLTDQTLGFYFLFSWFNLWSFYIKGCCSFLIRPIDALGEKLIPLDWTCDWQLIKMASLVKESVGSGQQISNITGTGKCESYLIFSSETSLWGSFRIFLYFMGLAYCFIGLSAITARFFRSMENVVKHSRKVVEIDPHTNTEIIRYEKVWNFTIADISLLAFGTSFPQISLATIDAIRNIGNLYAGGLFTFFLSPHKFWNRSFKWMNLLNSVFFYLTFYLIFF